LNKAGFVLYKWVSNNSVSNKFIRGTLIFDKDCNIKILRLQWNFKKDQFRISIDETNQIRITSKRSILSNIAYIFNPLELIGHYNSEDLHATVIAIKTGLGRSSSSRYAHLMRHYQTELSQLNAFHITQSIIVHTDFKKVENQLHWYE